MLHSGPFGSGSTFSEQWKLLLPDPLLWHAGQPTFTTGLTSSCAVFRLLNSSWKLAVRPCDEPYKTQAVICMNRTQGKRFETMKNCSVAGSIQKFVMVCI
jgi:hypothetical protein